MAILLHSLSTMNSSTLSLRGFVPLKPKEKIGRKYFKAVYPDQFIQMAMYPTRNLQIKNIVLKTSLMKTFYL